MTVTTFAILLIAAVAVLFLVRELRAVRELTLACRQTDLAELDVRTEEIRRMLDPVTRGIAELERDRREAAGQFGQMYRSLTEQVERLRTETGSLVTALRRPQVRGAWGEMQLRNVVEAANMTAHVDFHEQRTYTDTAGSRLRPDMTVRLPGDGSIIVDSKVPLDAYLAAYDATEDAERAAHLRRHAAQLRHHLDALASKRYFECVEGSPDCVVCFIPNDGIYCAALDADPTLLEHGSAQGVLIATPTTLMALLHAVHYGWRQERIAESAREIADAAQELHRRVGSFLEPYSKLGRQLNSTVAAYNASVGSFETRVLPQLRRIEAAGAASAKPLAQPAVLETAPRLVTAAEFDAA